MKSCPGDPCQGITEEPYRTLIQMWASKGGKWWVDIYHVTFTDFHTGLLDTCYTYDAVSAGGSLAIKDLPALLQRIANGDFQPDVNTTPMKRVR